MGVFLCGVLFLAVLLLGVLFLAVLLCGVLIVGVLFLAVFYPLPIYDHDRIWERNQINSQAGDQGLILRFKFKLFFTVFSTWDDKYFQPLQHNCIERSYYILEIHIQLLPLLYQGPNIKHYYFNP